MENKVTVIQLFPCCVYLSSNVSVAVPTHQYQHSLVAGVVLHDRRLTRLPEVTVHAEVTAATRSRKYSATERPHRTDWRIKKLSDDFIITLKLFPCWFDELLCQNHGSPHCVFIENNFSCQPPSSLSSNTAAKEMLYLNNIDYPDSSKINILTESQNNHKIVFRYHTEMGDKPTFVTKWLYDNSRDTDGHNPVITENTRLTFPPNLEAHWWRIDGNCYSSGADWKVK